MMDVLARRTIQSSDQSITVEVRATGNGPVLYVEGCPMIPLSVHETHKLLTRLARASIEGEGLTEAGEKLAAVLGELV